jgi:anti-anti-sigma factor
VRQSEKRVTLAIEDQPYGETLVVRLAGRLDTMTAKTFEDHLTRRLAEGTRRLIIDLAGVDYVSSYGLRVFLIHAKKLKADRNAFKLCAVTPEVLKILQISGFDKILAIRPSVAEEIASNKGSAP